MAFALFGRNKQISSPDLCRNTKGLLQTLSHEEKAPTKVEEELARNLSRMKLTLQGTTEIETSPQQVYQLVNLLMNEDLLYPLVTNIHKLPFESRKDIQLIWTSVFRVKPPHDSTQVPIVLPHIVNKRPEIMLALCQGCARRESFLHTGTILKEAVKHDSLAALIVYDEPLDIRPKGLVGVNPDKPTSGRGIFWQFFDWVDKCDFDMSADAFSIFRELLTKHKRLVIKFITVDYDRFVRLYNTMFLSSASYVTKRQSIKLLGEILLERQYYSFMTTYVENADHLKLAMNLLRDDRKMINYEAFHIFKVFVANPNKSVGVQKILINNRDRLLKFLPGFLEDRQDDVQFSDEKAYCIRQIEMLPPTPVGPMGQGPGINIQAGGGPGAVAV